MDQLQMLYESGINFQISGFFDEGFSWKLGDEQKGFKAEGTAKTMRIVIFDLTQAAIREYPDSEFATMHRGPIN